MIILGATNESQQIEPHSFVFLLMQQPPLLPRRGGVVSQKKSMLSLDTFQALNHTPIHPTTGSSTNSITKKQLSQSFSLKERLVGSNLKDTLIINSLEEIIMLASAVDHEEMADNTWSW